MKRGGAAPVAALALALGASRAAEAKLLDVYAGPRLGLMQGGENLRGLGLGVEVGAEVIVFDAIINYAQVVGHGALTQFLLGVDGDFGVLPQTYLRVGGAAGFGIRTYDVPSFPIDDRDVSHKGFVLQGTFALERHLGRFVVIGAEMVPAYHYFLKNDLVEQVIGTQMAPVAHWEHGGSFAMLLTIRAHFELLPRD